MASRKTHGRCETSEEPIVEIFQDPNDQGPNDIIRKNGGITGQCTIFFLKNLFFLVKNIYTEKHKMTSQKCVLFNFAKKFPLLIF